MGKSVIANRFVKGTLILMIFGLISKIIGAIYRIPLTRIITAEGMGIYQMIFPLYTLLLTLSSSGLPSSISKLISECYAKKQFKQAERILKTSFFLLFLFSVVCVIFVIIFAKNIASLQGNINAYYGYLGLAPAILFVGLISGFRGYFQGKGVMFPSAFSQFIEQLIKLVFGLFFAYIFKQKGVHFAVFGAVLGISLSEIIAFVYLFLSYFFRKNKHIESLDNFTLTYKQTAKSILSYSILVTLGGLIMPLTMLVDSAVVINILKKLGYSASFATSLFGIQTGTVGSIINMPVVLSLALSTAILPFVSREKTKNNQKGVVEYSSKAILITIIIGLPASFGCIALSEPIVKLLYQNSLTELEIVYASNLLELASVGIFYLAMVQVTSGILQGISKFYIPLISLFTGALIKIVLNLVLISNAQINIFGAEISTVVCYIIAFIINISFLIKNKVFDLDYRVFIVFLISFAVFLVKYLFNFLLKMKINFYFSLILVVVFTVAIYLILIFVLYKNMLKKRKINKND